MRLLDLTLHNVGPFADARLDLCTPDDPFPVAILAGTNATGKTILLDAIRGLFGPAYGHLERPIVRKGERFWLEATAFVDGARRTLSAERTLGGFDLYTENGDIGDLPLFVQQGRVRCPGWVVDSWRPAMTTEPGEFRGFIAPDPRSYLFNALAPGRRNPSELLCHFDYARTSAEPRERRAGEALWEAAGAILRAVVPDAELLPVARLQMAPQVARGGLRMPIAALGTGATWAVQNGVTLLGRMLAAHILADTDPESLTRTPGLLLVDDVEAHLGPMQQMRFFGEMARIFPGLQIIATTRSPFVVASAPAGRIFVCRLVEGQAGAVVEDRTGTVAGKSVDALLAPGAMFR
jgi:hypothetical protein